MYTKFQVHCQAQKEHPDLPFPAFKAHLSSSIYSLKPSPTNPASHGLPPPSFYSTAPPMLTPLFLFFLNFIYLFIFGCVGSSLLHAGFLQLLRAGATLRGGVWASHCGGFSCCGAQALGARASIVVLSSCGSWVLECRLSSGT